MPDSQPSKLSAPEIAQNLAVSAMMVLGSWAADNMFAKADLSPIVAGVGAAVCFWSAYRKVKPLSRLIHAIAASIFLVTAVGFTALIATTSLAFNRYLVAFVAYSLAACFGTFLSKSSQ